MLDGATGGNNAFAILALIKAYKAFDDIRYLESARKIAKWIAGTLSDNSGIGYGGYYQEFADGGEIPKPLLRGKSTENNASIFAAFTSLAAILDQSGRHMEAWQWRRRADAAGEFVMAMYDSSSGCFNAGTVLEGTPFGPGIDPRGLQRGEDVINVLAFLDANTIPVLALANHPSYRNRINWQQPVQYVLDRFKQSVEVNERIFQGFNIVEDPIAGPDGIAWEFTAQAVLAMRSVNGLYGESYFERDAGFYLEQIHQAQRFAAFGDGLGITGSTLQNGDLLPPYEHCLKTPFRCIPQRVELAATNWSIFANQTYNIFL